MQSYVQVSRVAATFWPLLRIKGGVVDEAAFVDFARAEHQRLLRVALLLTGERQGAEDLVQEALVRAYVHWGKVARANSPRAYTRRLMTNVFLRQREQAAARPQLVPAEGDPGTDGGFGRIDTRDEVRRALAALPRRQRTAVVLRHYERMTEAETAEAMGCSAGTVKSLTSRGLASLRQQMAPDREQRSQR